jgi:hypothetical protein
MGATAGDLFARDLTARWLSSSGWAYDIAVARPFVDGVDWRKVDPADYDMVVFVCGPFGNGWPITEFLHRFAGRKLIGLNLSMLEDVEQWDPFDVLIERDSSRNSRPDISFLSDAPPVPLVGVVLVERQGEYSDSLHDHANAAIDRLLSGRDLVRVPIDTRLDTNQTGLGSARQVESLIARMDAVVTTRLHGMVLAVKNGVPPVVIDPIGGGRKVITQARTIGWSRAYTADRLDDKVLQDALDDCLSPAGREEVLRTRDRAIAAAAGARDAFLAAVIEHAGETP